MVVVSQEEGTVPVIKGKSNMLCVYLYVLLVSCHSAIFSLEMNCMDI